MGQKSKQGSFTIEASLLMPFIVFVLITLIYMGFYFHDKTLLQTAVNDVSIKQAKALKYTEVDITTGAVNFQTINDRNLYWRWTNLNTEPQNEKAYLIERLHTKLFQVNPEAITINTRVEKNLISHYVVVECVAPFNTPFNFIPMLLNKGQPLRITAQSKAMMPDHQEFVRTIDLMQYAIDNLAFLEGMNNAYQEALNTIESHLQ
ncbi:TadE-like protein [Natranaerovirga hydrolytica]|uniref:TadE-like protein n=1 Tax=Natranaerovirga hydrolytica TaxID=680378 RepID=A0A4R1MJY0_9FIRM|nr:TadE family protein [Natranaerovirga hydrolytica]TCK93108.1 TadE-like protein [Natranaerovirga hydrolytica]